MASTKLQSLACKLRSCKLSEAQFRVQGVISYRRELSGFLFIMYASYYITGLYDGVVRCQ